MLRRDFIKAAAIGTGLAICPRIITPKVYGGEAPDIEITKDLHEAKYYKKLENNIIECELCPRKCRVSDLERGYCGVRENIGGEYFTLVYGQVCTANIDPIEKKPFFHYLPGSTAFSIATAGCNMNCKFCQNWNISQFRPEDVNHVELKPVDCAQNALQNDCQTIAYTYSEPTIFYEYMYDCAVEGSKHGIRSAVVSAGYIQEEPLNDLMPVVDAIKIDLKAFSDSYYKDICNGQLQPVLETLVTIKNANRWLEIVYLMVPGLNDGKDEITKLCNWILTNLGPDVPIHFTRFHPSYLLQNLPMTPLASLEQAHQIARAKGLHYPYIGNVFGHDAENTYCHSCGKLLISRRGFQITANNLEKGRCPGCQTIIPGVWA